MKNLVLSICCALLFLSCSNSKKVTNSRKELNEIVVSAANNEYRASETKYWDIVHTDISLRFNLKERTVEGTAKLRLHPYAYAQDQVVLDAKGMSVQSVYRKNSGGRSEFQLRNDSLIISFGQIFSIKDTIELSIDYKASPYESPTGGSAAITDDRGLYFINTNNEIPGKPVQVWTQGETQANSHWFPTIDKPNEKFTTSVTLLVPDSFTTLSNGLLVSSTREGNGMRKDRWEMHKQIQTYAVMFAIGKYTIVKDREWNGKEVSYYVEPEYARYAKLMFKNTPEMMDYFSAVTGVPYPWSKYSQVVARDYVSGAMENTSATLFGEFINQNAREISDKAYEDIVSHELFHQWFGDYVTAESWSNLTLNESFATYGQQLWRKHKYGDPSNQEMYYSDLLAYLRQAENDDPHLVRYYYNNREDMFDNISYQKGSLILHYLHGLVGDSSFYRAMQSYLTKNALQNAEASDWRKAIEEATGKDWNWFFNQWYYRGGHPELNVEYSYNDAQQQLQVTVSQVQADSAYIYKLPLKAILVYGNKKETIDWNIQKRRQTFTYAYKDGVKPLFIPDSEHWLVGKMSDKKTTSDALLQFRALGDDYIGKRRSLSGAYSLETDQTVFHDALKDKMKEIRVYALTVLEAIPERFNWKKNFKDEVTMLAINDGNNLVRANAWSVLGTWKITSVKDDMIKALDDSSYAVAGAALSALAEIDSLEAYGKARVLATRDPKAALQDAVWETLAKGGSDQDAPFLEQDALRVYGRRKISLGNNIYLYSIRSKDDRNFERAMSLLARMAKAESIKSYRFSVGSLVFNAASYYKDLIHSKDKIKAANAKARLQVAEKYGQDILSAEDDDNNLQKYKQL